MAQTTPFTIGTEARCADGACGKVSRVVVDPVARAVTHLVIGRQGVPRLVPLDLIDATTGQIRLGCTLAEFDKLDPAEKTQFLPGSRHDTGYPPDQVLTMPYYGLADRYNLPRQADMHITYDTLPRAGPCHRRHHRASSRAGHRPWQPPCHPRAPAGGPPVGPQGSGHPDQRRDRSRRGRCPAQPHQAAGAGTATRRHRPPQRVGPVPVIRYKDRPTAAPGHICETECTQQTRRRDAWMTPSLRWSEPSEATPTSCPGPADPIKQITDPCPHRLASAQNAQIWTASVVISIEPMPAQSGGYLGTGVDRHEH
jgi:hypothetical protein